MRPTRAGDAVFVADPPMPPTRPRRAAAKPASERVATRAPAIVTAETPAVIASAAAQAAPVASRGGAIWSVAGGMVEAARAALRHFPPHAEGDVTVIALVWLPNPVLRDRERLSRPPLNLRLDADFNDAVCDTLVVGGLRTLGARF